MASVTYALKRSGPWNAAKGRLGTHLTIGVLHYDTKRTNFAPIVLKQPHRPSIFGRAYFYRWLRTY